MPRPKAQPAAGEVPVPRVAILCEFPTLHGGERSLLAVLPAVRQAGFEPLVLAPPVGPLADELASQAIQHIPYDSRSVEGADKLAAARRALTQLLPTLAVDVLHANSLSMARLSGPVAAGLALPSIGHLRDIVRLSRAAVTDLNRHTRLLAVSRATRDFHVAQGLAPEKVFVLYNGIDVAAFASPMRSRLLADSLNLPPDARLVGNIGQWILRKGQDVLCAAFEIVAARTGDVHLLLVGERSSAKPETVEFARQLQQRAACPPLAGRVHCLGSRADVWEWLAQLDVLAHAAQQEPLGRVLLEAAAAGVPVVATDCGGTGEIFGTGDAATASLVPVNDPQALAEAILAVLSDPAAAQERAARARERVIEHFSVERAAAGLIAHYGAVVHATSAGERSRH